MINQLIDCCYGCFVGQHAQERPEDISLALNILAVETDEQLKEEYSSVPSAPSSAYGVELSKGKVTSKPEGEIE